MVHVMAGCLDYDYGHGCNYAPRVNKDERYITSGIISLLVLACGSISDKYIYSTLIGTCTWKYIFLICGLQSLSVLYNIIFNSDFYLFSEQWLIVNIT